MDEFCTSISAQERCPSVKFGISGLYYSFRFIECWLEGRAVIIQLLVLLQSIYLLIILRLLYGTVSLPLNAAGVYQASLQVTSVLIKTIPFLVYLRQLLQRQLQQLAQYHQLNAQILCGLGK